MKKILIAKTKEDFDMLTTEETLKASIGGYSTDIIREYIVKNISVEQAYMLWKEDKITFAELQYVKEMKNKND